jgi:hypothetical protein
MAEERREEENRKEKTRKENTLVGFSEETETVYALYPARDANNGGRSTGKTIKDKIKIDKLIKQGVPLKRVIEKYLANCSKTREYLKNLGTLLNNLPDESALDADPKPILKPKRPPYVPEVYCGPPIGWGVLGCPPSYGQGSTKPAGLP